MCAVRPATHTTAVAIWGVQTETLMHAAHMFETAGLLQLFFEGTGLDPSWTVPPGAGGQDPYLKPRGGTKMKKSNKKLR